MFETIAELFGRLPGSHPAESFDGSLEVQKDTAARVLIINTATDSLINLVPVKSDKSTEVTERVGQKMGRIIQSEAAPAIDFNNSVGMSETKPQPAIITLLDKPSVDDHEASAREYVNALYEEHEEYNGRPKAKTDSPSLPPNTELLKV